MSIIIGIIDEIPWIAMAAWIGLLFYYTEKMHTKICVLQNKYDPKHVFVHDVGGMQLSRNLFRVNKKHPLCTEEFLKEWDGVYGVYWRRVIPGLCLVPIIILMGRLVRLIIMATIENLTL
jgi:hypothetical protein